MKRPASRWPITIVFFLCVSAAAQQKPPQPQTVGLVHLLNSTGSIAPLERQTAAVRVRLFKITAEVKGDSSPVRLEPDAKQEFVVALPAGVDPSRFEIYSMEAGKGKRQASLIRDRQPASASGGGALQLNASKNTDGSYRLAPRQNLSPGEYCLVPPGELHDLFCFGIDSAGK